ncbi:MAG: hypothetical protein E6I18_05910 [Chloroflexi bacterium]|nr:MAG: hypothetical protein E6I18_05910 [Chloroflexota bacterium]
MAFQDRDRRVSEPAHVRPRRRHKGREPVARCGRPRGACQREELVGSALERSDHAHRPRARRLRRDLPSSQGTAGDRVIIRTLVALALAALAASACTTASAAQLPTHIGIRIHYSHFDQTKIDVPMGVPVTFTLINDDPIDHEWLIGDEAFHARHRAGTEAVHGDRPNEVSLPPLSVKTTTLTFDKAGPLTFICHFPQHEAYGMVGVVMVKP